MAASGISTSSTTGGASSQGRPGATGIVTPEAVVLELETAGVATRLLAALVDAVISVGLLIGALTVSAGAATAGGSASQVFVVFAVFTVLLVVPTVEQMVMRGRTVGKAALGLRAVTLEGAPIRFRHAVVRSMGGLVDRLLPPGGITGLLLVLGTQRSQTIGDLLAGTIVVRDSEGRGAAAAMWFPVPAGYEGYAATIDPTAMTVDQYTVVRAFLLRNRSLSADARWSLSLDLAGRLAATVRHERPESVHPETFLLCAISRYQRRNFPAYQPASWTQR